MSFHSEYRVPTIILRAKRYCCKILSCTNHFCVNSRRMLEVVTNFVQKTLNSWICTVLFWRNNVSLMYCQFTIFEVRVHRYPMLKDTFLATEGDPNCERIESFRKYTRRNRDSPRYINI